MNAWHLVAAIGGLLVFAIVLVVLLIPVADSVVPEPVEPVEPEVVYVEVPGPPPPPVHVKVPVPFAVADESIGAYRVNGFVTFKGGPVGSYFTTRQPMACFPLD